MIRALYCNILVRLINADVVDDELVALLNLKLMPLLGELRGAQILVSSQIKPGQNIFAAAAVPLVLTCAARDDAGSEAIAHFGKLVSLEVENLRTSALSWCLES
ncbi:hypothetical protein HDV00_011622 [Rhizophlyctis rosea]|nr:hypothetical protein HDV00_011622 [Rhizophlyctis rosea]